MVARAMRDRGTSVRQLATQLGVTEGVVRYRLKKAEAPDLDGRAEQSTALDGYEAAVRAIQERLGDGRLTGEGRPCQVREIYRALARDYGYTGWPHRWRGPLPRPTRTEPKGFGGSISRTLSP